MAGDAELEVSKLTSKVPLENFVLLRLKRGSDDEREHIMQGLRCACEFPDDCGVETIRKKEKEILREIKDYYVNHHSGIYLVNFDLGNVEEWDKFIYNLSRPNPSAAVEKTIFILYWLYKDHEKKEQQKRLNKQAEEVAQKIWKCSIADALENAKAAASTQGATRGAVNTGTSPSRPTEGDNSQDTQTFQVDEVASLAVAIIVYSGTNPTTQKVITGLSITDDLILTARDPLLQGVGDADPEIEVFWHVGGGNEKGDWEPVQVDIDSIIWDGGDGLNAALLRCPRPEELQGLPEIPLRRLPPTAKGTWHGLVYPHQFQSESPREVQPLKGAVAPSMTEGEVPDIRLEDSLQPVQNSGDVVGMPVFAGGELLGVTTGIVQRSGVQHLNIAPTWEILPSAHDLFDGEDFRKFREDMRKSLVEILSEHSSLAQTLAGEFKVPVADDTNPRLADAILDSEPRAWLLRLMRIKIENPRHAKAIVALTGVTLPALRDRTVAGAVARVNDEAGGLSFVALGIATRTVCELAMARADGAKAIFRTPPPKESDSVGEFSLDDLPDPGRDQDGAQTTVDFVTNLERYLIRDFETLGTSFSRNLEDRFITGSLENRYKTTEARENSIKGYLKDEHEIRGRRFYYAVILPDDPSARAAARAVFEPIKRTFPLIVFLELNKEDMQIGTEEDEYRQVANILRPTDQESS